MYFALNSLVINHSLYWRGRKPPPFSTMRLPDPKPKRPPVDKDSVWDSDESPILEYGTVDELRATLIEILERQLQFLKCGDAAVFGRIISDTWPWTKIGLDFLRGIRLADAILKQMDTQDEDHA